MDEETKAFICLLRFGYGMKQKDISKLVGYSPPYISYTIKKIMTFKSAHLSKNETIKINSRINDNFTCGDQFIIRKISNK